MSEPSPEAKQAALLEQQEHSRPNPHPVGYHVQEAIDTATAKVREELEQLRTASFHDVSESIARMVIEYVEGWIKLGTDWRNGLADVIALRLKRLQMQKADK